MKCPICTESDLVMTERKGVEIDYCPKCRGVWLDRGELDKIIERGTVEPEPGLNSSSRPRDYHAPQGQSRRPDEYYGHKRRKSWLSEIFD